MSIKKELTGSERRIVIDIIKKYDGVKYKLYCATVMPDHVHLIIQPLEISNKPNDWYPLSKIMQQIKGSSAREINKGRKRTGSVWLEESYDRIMRNEKELFEKWQYIYNNPLKAGLVTAPEDYEYFYCSQRF